MAKKSIKKTVGSELVSRLKGFTDKHSTIEDPKKLANILTVRKVTLNRAPKTFAGSEVKAIRKALNVSQPVLAQFLGVSIAAVRDWEQNINSPSGPVCRIFEEMQKAPQEWFHKFRSLAPASSKIRSRSIKH